MKNTVYLICFLIIICACKTYNKPNSGFIVKKESLDNYVNPNKLKKILIHDDYKLEIETIFLNEKLYLDKNEDPLKIPIVTQQKLFFYHKNTLIKNYNSPINITDTVLKNNKIKFLSIPLIEFCLIRGETGIFMYYIYGSNYCNGVECSEFIGLYTMNGEIIYEGISTTGVLSKKYLSLKETCNKFKVDINKTINCQNIIID